MLPGVLVRLADRLHRQDADIEIGGRPLHQEVQMALVDDGIGADWQMRPMLLDGGDREDRDGLLRIEAVEFGGGEVVPPDLAIGHEGTRVRQRPENHPAAMASISTTNSGRAKPETIISVEAG